MAKVEVAGNSGIRDVWQTRGRDDAPSFSPGLSVRHLVGRNKEERKKEKTARIQGKTQHSSPSS